MNLPATITCKLKGIKERYAFENACNSLFYGTGSKSWNRCGVNDKRAEKIWEMAFNYMEQLETPYSYN